MSQEHDVPKPWAAAKTVEKCRPFSGITAAVPLLGVSVGREVVCGRFFAAIPSSL